jgi:hypothetical protein
VLLVREHGQLIEKERFFSEVWQDVVVSDSALTQCIKDIRKQLGDDAGNPRYIETVPRYGYRFIGPVQVVRSESALPRETLDALPAGGSEDPRRPGPQVVVGGRADTTSSVVRGQRGSWQGALLWAGAGALGGGFAGVLGGLLYGSALAHTPAAAGLGTASILLVLLSVNVLVGLIGGAGVSLGMAAVGWFTRRSLRWSVAGAAAGGLIVGSGAKLLGVDAFNLLFGTAPAGITGGLEGAALGAALALGARIAGGTDSPRWRPVAGAGVAGGVAGALIHVAGGRLMGGSLQLLAGTFGDSRLQLDALGRFFGEVHFGYTTQLVLSGVEGFLFAACVAGGLMMAGRVLGGGVAVD